MAFTRWRREAEGAGFWPGFVDSITTLLLVMIFLLSVFMLAQFFLTQEISGRDNAMVRLRDQVAELTSILALEKAERDSAEARLAILRNSLDAANAVQDELRAALAGREGILQALGADREALSEALDTERRGRREANSQLELLSLQIGALRRQLSAIEETLSIAEDKDRESQAKIADLGRRLNVALASKVQELARYRSDFFGRLRQILVAQPNVRIVGDRFVLPSEVLFESGSAEINALGRSEVRVIAEAILELDRLIPDDISWILRVDGHTDNQPIRSDRYPSNWDLSVARALSVVRQLIAEGVKPNRLVAAGFGEFHPIDLGEGQESFRRNRRIELKLTER